MSLIVVPNVKAAYIMYVGETMTISKGRTINGTTRVDWSYNKMGYVDIISSNNDNCTIKAKKSGTVTMVATHNYTRQNSAGWNYTEQYTEYITVEIIPQMPTSLSIPSSMTIYTGETRQIPITVVPSDAQKACSWKSDSVSIATVSSGGYVTGVSAGTTVITASNSSGLTSRCTVTVKSDGLSFADKEFVYDGNEKQISISGSLPSGCSVSYSNNKQKAAGVYSVTATVSGSYSKTLTAKMTIKPKELTITGLTAESKVYDGTDEATIKGGILNGIVSTDNVTFIPPKGTFASVNAGNNIEVKLSEIELSGTDKGNYTLKQPTGLRANITKAPITVTVKNAQKKAGTEDPEFKYDYSGTLYGSDEFTGNLTRQQGEKAGRYNILIGTLAINNNYQITYNKGVLEIFDKTPQNITVSEIGAKAYGDADFDISVVPDSVSGLDEFTFASSKPEVAEIDSKGTVTIKSAGETQITVKQAGDTEYAPIEQKVTLVVNPKQISIVDLDINEKTARFDGVLPADEEAVELDFDKIQKNVGGITVKGETKVATLTVTNFVLKGGKASNYTVVTESIEADTAVDLVTNIEKSEDLSADVDKVDGVAIISNIDTTAMDANDDKAVFDMTAEGGIKSVAITAEELRDLSGKKKLELKIKDDKNKPVDITFDKATLQAISEGKTGLLSFEAKETEDEALNDKQKARKKAIAPASKKPMSYSLNIENGNTNFGTGKASVTLSYDKGTVKGNVKAVCLKDDGSTENVAVTYDEKAKAATLALSHFSDYLIYTEPNTTTIVPTGGGGGGGGGAPIGGGGSSSGGSNAEKRQIVLAIGQTEAKIWGETVNNDVAPIIRNDRTMLPIRLIAEALGAKVDWDAENRVVTITRSKTVIKIIIDSKIAIVNGNESELDSPAFIENDRTFMPIRFVSEKLGAKVEWIGESKQVVITKITE